MKTLEYNGVLMSQLNSQQQEAVETTQGPLLVLAGAGSGKTRVVTQRIAHLIGMGVHPSQILGLTFTNKAAAEMKERVQQLTHCQVIVSTFHSLGARILRESIHHLGYRHGFSIYDDEDVNKVIKACLSDLKISDPKRKIHKGARQFISQAKNNIQLPADVNVSELVGDVEEMIPQIYAHYQEALLQYNAVDFDDLLLLPVRLFEEHPDVLESYQEKWHYLMIDEYQDTNEAQYRIVKHLVAKQHNLCVVGDPDQSIYSWRGANLSNILNFSKDYPEAKLIRLEQNYRSRSNILNGANAVVGHNQQRYEKNLWSDRGEGEKIKFCRLQNEQAEAQFIAKKVEEYHQKGTPLTEMAVFYRTNAQSRSFEDSFLSRNIPYVLVGSVSFYQRREIKDILAYLKIVFSGDDFISFSRTINLPRRGIGGATIDKLRLGSAAVSQSLIPFCEETIAGRTSLKLTQKQQEAISDYLRILRELREIAKNGTIADLVQGTIEKTGYMSVLEEDKETRDDRKENLGQLVNKAFEWHAQSSNPTLESFLEELSLRSNLDEAEGVDERVPLMTLHNGKGLEFDVVFLAGLEEGLLPHVNSYDHPESMEEERRLAYVGMTRAKEVLYMLHVQARFLWGSLRTQRPSRFLSEVPREYCEEFRSSAGMNPLRKRLREGTKVFHQSYGVGVIEEELENDTFLIHFTRDGSELELTSDTFIPLSPLSH